MSWENVSGEFHQFKGNGISVTEVSLHHIPEDPENHAEHDDSYYYVGDEPINDVDTLIKAVGLIDEHHNMKVVVCTPRSSTLIIEDGQARIEPDFMGSSEDVYWFDDNGKEFNWEMNDDDEWERIYN